MLVDEGTPPQYGILYKFILDFIREFYNNKLCPLTYVVVVAFIERVW